MFGAAYNLIIQMYRIEMKVLSKSVNSFFRERGTKTRPRGITKNLRKGFSGGLKEKMCKQFTILRYVHIVGLQTKDKTLIEDKLSVIRLI